MVFEAHHGHDDNMLRACRDTNIILEIKRRVCERFDITDMNESGQFFERESDENSELSQT